MEQIDAFSSPFESFRQNDFFSILWSFCQEKYYFISEGRVYNPDVSRHIAENQLAENWTLS